MHNFSSLLRRESISECDLEITQGYLVALPINKAQQGSCRSSDVIARRSRTQRDYFCGKNKSQPLEPISDSLPARPHGGVSTTKFECLTPCPRNDESRGSSTTPALGYLPEANFFETPPADARLLSAGPPRAPVVQDWAPNRHSRATRQGESKSKMIW